MQIGECAISISLIHIPCTTNRRALHTMHKVYISKNPCEDKMLEGRSGGGSKTGEGIGAVAWVARLDGSKNYSFNQVVVHQFIRGFAFLLYFLVQKKARNIRAESSRGLSRLCGESSNVLMLHMVTSGPSRGPTSSPHTEDRRSTSQGLSHTLCARTCCPVGIHPTCDRDRETHQR